MRRRAHDGGDVGLQEIMKPDAHLGAVLLRGVPHGPHQGQDVARQGVDLAERMIGGVGMGISAP
jgi:hypothetical protein